MKHRSAIALMLALSVFATGSGCAKKKITKAAATEAQKLNIQQLISETKDAATESMTEKNSGKAENAAIRGMELGRRCIEAAPQEAACYYWRAVNTGLYHKVHIIGYQRGIKQMIADCQKVIELEAGYDNAGAYRILGQIYTQLPQTGGQAESVVRDLDLASTNLREAVRLAPDYPENHLAFAETLFAEERFTDARWQLTEAKRLTPAWRQDISYNDWHATIRTLEKKIAKAVK